MTRARAAVARAGIARRCGAVLALGAGLVALLAALSCAPAEDLDKLLNDAINNTDVEARQEAADKIEKIVEQGDYQVFVRGIRSQNLFNRAQAILLLGRMPQPGARQALRGLLAADQRMMLPFNPVRLKPDREPSDSRILVATLIRRGGGDKEAAPILLAGAETNQTTEALVGLCFAIGALRDPAGLPFLEKATRHPDKAVARAAVQAVGQFPEPEALAILKAQAQHPDVEVRADVLSALATRDDEATRDLLKSMGEHDPSPDIRTGAYQSLSRFKGPDMVPYYIDRLKDAPAPSREVLAQNLAHLTGETLGEKSDAWGRWWERHKGDARWSR